MKWIDSKELYTEKNYSLARKGKGKYYHLFTRHGNESLSFINDNSKNKLKVTYLFSRNWGIHINIIANSRLTTRSGACFTKSGYLKSFSHFIKPNDRKILVSVAES